MGDPDDLLRRGHRLKAAIYRLAKGRPNVEVTKAEVVAEVERERLFELSDVDFMAYARKVLAEVHAWREANPDEAGVDVRMLSRAEEKRARKAARRIDHARRRQAGLRR